MAETRYYGIRHHGPGSARALLQALTDYQPDAVLIEGPADATPIMHFALDAQMQPPVALLSYSPEHPGYASFYPYAEFSPEWQAIRYALATAAMLRMIDLPATHRIAFDTQRLHPTATPETGSEAAECEPESADDNAEVDARPSPRSDPLQWLARAAGYADGEAFWSQMVEERGEGADLFEAIELAMTELRAAYPTEADPSRQQLEQAREAHMRNAIRAAQDEGVQRIAVVCGAWHVPALRATTSRTADQQQLKGLPKCKAELTWVPYSDQLLTRASGYGAGIDSPGWYRHLYAHGADPQQRSVGWYARVARLLRERDLDCSSAHLIEATRLAQALSALRERPAASLAELDSAAVAVIGFGDPTQLAFIERELKIGHGLGQVPESVPVVPLLRDLQAEQKRLRLKAEALDKTLDLDLRQDRDRERSRLLHRLNLLGVPWGELLPGSRNARGSFHELWRLQWQPSFQLTLIEAAVHGPTVEIAATTVAVDHARSTGALEALAALLDRVLLAELRIATQALVVQLEQRAGQSSDALQMLKAVPPLANIQRYGNVRQTDLDAVSLVLDGLIVRAAIALPLAAAGIDEQAADELRGAVLGAHGAVALRSEAESSGQWPLALQQLMDREHLHPLLRGLATRLRFDDGALSLDEVASALSYALSMAADPSAAAQWLDGFINRSALVLVHDPKLFGLVDDWLSGLSDEHFIAISALLKRTFAEFSDAERRDLAVRAVDHDPQRAQPNAVAAEPGWDVERAAWLLPMFRELLGVQP